MWGPGCLGVACICLLGVQWGHLCTLPSCYANQTLGVLLHATVVLNPRLQWQGDKAAAEASLVSLQAQVLRHAVAAYFGSLLHSMGPAGSSCWGGVAGFAARRRGLISSKKIACILYLCLSCSVKYSKHCLEDKNFLSIFLKSWGRRCYRSP